MMHCLIIPIVLLSQLSWGGKVGITSPTNGIARTNKTATDIGTFFGYSSSRSGIELIYSFRNFPSPRTLSYQLILQELALLYTYELLYRPHWGIGIQGGGGISFITRSLPPVKEIGKTPTSHFGFVFIQHQGKSRVSAGMDNVISYERADKIHLTYFPSIYVKVAYVF